MVCSFRLLWICYVFLTCPYHSPVRLEIHWLLLDGELIRACLEWNRHYISETMLCAYGFISCLWGEVVSNCSFRYYFFYFYDR